MADRPGDSHLRAAEARCIEADIKTVDAFCAGFAPRERAPAVPWWRSTA